MINLNIVVNGQNELSGTRHEDNRFIGDYETIEFVASNYDYLLKTDTDHKHKENELYETVIAVNYSEMTFYKITAKTQHYNNETQVSFSQQELTLQGFNYFTKDSEEDFTDIYNLYLNSKGYDFTLQDVIELAEIKPDFNNARILQFKDERENKHYITVNERGQLSKITVKLSDMEVKPKIKSAFGF